MTFAPPVRKPPAGRLIACVRCGQLVEIWDLNGAVTDPTTFVGGCCLEVRRADQ